MGAIFNCFHTAASPLKEGSCLCCLIGTVANSFVKPQWDAGGLNAPNCLEAERYLKQEYREGWKTWLSLQKHVRDRPLRRIGTS